MKKCVLVGVPILILNLMVGSLGYGSEENSNDHSGVYTLGEVVVTGKGSGVESIGTVREIKSEDIEKKGARTLNEALELLPGLDIRTGAQGIPRINLRGLRSRHVVLLLNGIPFNSTYDGQFDPSIIPVENIAKIKVSYGNHSVLYGEGGLGGVINIITKKGEAGFQGTAVGELGERGDTLYQTTLSGGEEKVNFFVSGSSFESDGFRLSDDFDETIYEDGGLRENSDNKRKNIFANAGFSPNENWDIGMIINYLQGEFGKPPGTLDNSDPFANRLKYERVEDYDGISGQVSMNYNASGPFSMRSWIFINQLDQEENSYDDSNYNSIAVRRSFLKDNETQIYGGTIQTSYDLETTGLFTLSLSTEKQEFETSGVIRDVNLGGGNWGLRSFDEEEDLNTYSTALEYEVSPFDNFGLVLGYGHHWLKKGAGENDDHGSFLAGMHYDVGKSTGIWGSVARKIRFPSIKQFYDEAPAGNEDLQTEKSYNFELGVQQTFSDHTTITVTGFLIDMEDYIEKNETTDQYENNDKYRFQGFELTAETRAIENLLLRAGYSFMDAEDRSSGSEIDELEYRPEQKFTFEGEYCFPFGISAFMNVMHVKNQHYYSRSAPFIQRKLDNYTLVNLKIESSFLNDKMTLYLGADNIFDEDYEESYAFPQAGRNVYTGMKVLF